MNANRNIQESFSIVLNILWIKLLVFVVLMWPLGSLAWNLYNNQLGINPIEKITHETGEWGLRILLLTLAVSPLRRVFHFNGLIHLRRVFGLASFTYVLAHFCIYLILDQWFDAMAIIEDVIKRPYITVGFIAFVLMVPLAITSTNSMQRWLQHKWVVLHRLTYIIAILGVAHFWWLVKADLKEPIIYASVLAVLFAYRVYYKFVRV